MNRYHLQQRIHAALFLAVGTLGLQLALISPSYGDGKETEGVTKPNPARDERLPPVIPGEVVKGDDGSEIKVWSSAGPVPSGQVPAAPGVPSSALGGVGQGGVQGVLPGGIGGVIIDGRGVLPNTSSGETAP
jgi:hypothetical protein